jgi:hypothetical protein
VVQQVEISGNLGLRIAVPYIAAASGAAGGGNLVCPGALQIVSATWTANATLTGQATNFVTISFFNRTTGAGTIQWATAIAYSSGGVVATKATPVTLTLSSTATDLQPAAGDVLAVEITTTGTGLTVPGGVVELNARFR